MKNDELARNEFWERLEKLHTPEEIQDLLQEWNKWAETTGCVYNLENVSDSVEDCQENV